MKSILVPGRSCWRVEGAERAAVLVDGEAYYRAVREALRRARSSIHILGWDIDSRLRLVRGDDGRDGLPEALGELLDAVVSRPHGPHAYVLAWDFAMVYALEREWLPVYRLDWRTHRRLCFRMDDRHPMGGSQHQKVVVVDDRVAFVGGFDLSKWRWDTSAHAPDEPRRSDPEGRPYPPFHDVAMLVEGDAAAALGDLARERWRWATGETLPVPAAGSAEGGSPWPPGVAAQLHRVPIAIARTLPAYRGRAEVREVERLYLDALAAAERWVYVENQYLTSDAICAALAERLAKPAGPEVVLVLPLQTGGWLEQYTMDVLRARVLARLREADAHGRLRVLYPYVPGLGEKCVSLHSKLMVVDDRLLRLGSANLSNRSMGLDSECDLAFEAGPGDAIGQAVVAGVRDRLLAEHLGVEPGAVAERLAQTGSLVAAVDALQHAGRSLRPLDGRVSAEVQRLVPEAAVVDPERPVAPEKLVDQFLQVRERRPAGRRLVAWSLGLLALLALAGLWRWTPLSDALSAANLARLADQWRDSPAAPLAVLGAFVAGSLLVAPVTVLVVATVLVFGPWLGFAYSLVGTLTGALITYGVGHWLGRGAVRRLAGRRLNRLSRRLARRGLLAIITVQVVPVAPFTVVNLVAGASHIRFRDFLLGSVLGLTPGTFAVAVLTDRMAATVEGPDVTTVLILVAVTAALVAAGLALRRWLVQRSTG